MITRSTRLLMLAAITTLACAAPSIDPALRGAPESDAVVAEARAFMDAYARELLAGDRAAIAARYDRTGAYLVRDGEKSFVTYADIVARYARPGWSPPASFEWRDLSFEPVGSDAVVVVGHFLWTRQTGATPMSISYTALLWRQDGELRIRVEDEQLIPERRPGGSDSP